MINRNDTNEQKRKRGPAKGTRPKNLDALHVARRGARLPSMQGDRHPLWSGDNPSYIAVHAWVRRKFVKPEACELCGKTGNGYRYEWHNKDKKYSRNREDWQYLCVTCHRRLTFSAGDYEIWNKGKKIQTNTGKTHIKPGEHISPATEFKRGLVPHNKYLEPKACKQCGREFQPREANRLYCCKRCYWDSLKQKTGD